MSSVYKQGETYVLRLGVGRARQVRRLGDLTRDGAKTVAHHVAQIERSRKAAVSLPAATATWLDEITDDLHAKLAALGLVAPRGRPDNGGIPTTIGRLWDDFFARRPDLKKWTLSNLEQTKLRCIEFFKLKPVGPSALVLRILVGVLPIRVEDDLPDATSLLFIPPKRKDRLQHHLCRVRLAGSGHTE